MITSFIMHKIDGMGSVNSGNPFRFCRSYFARPKLLLRENSFAQSGMWPSR